MRTTLIALAALLASPALAQPMPIPGFGTGPVPQNPQQQAPQYNPQQQQSGVQGVLFGAWHITVSTPSGPVEVFTSYFPNGNFEQAAVASFGAARVAQHWGRYAVQQTGQNQLLVQYQPAGTLPQRVCTQGGSCFNTTPMQPGSDNFTIMDQNTMQSASGIMQRTQFPPQLLQPLPAIFYTPGLPQQYPQQPTGGARYRTPYDPGRGSNGDDLQQQRICAINDGHIVRMADGHLRCIN